MCSGVWASDLLGSQLYWSFVESASCVALPISETCVLVSVKRSYGIWYCGAREARYRGSDASDSYVRVVSMTTLERE